MHITRKAGAILASCATAAALTLTAPPVHAATCQGVPGSTPGTDVRLAGQDHRVPSISNIRVCADGPTAPLVVVDVAGHGNCLSPCLSILLDGDDLDGGAVTVSYARDGVVQTSTTDLPPVGGPGDECLLSVGSPKAPYPDCFNAIGPDLGDPLGGAGDDVDAAVATVWGAVGTALDLAGSVGDEANEAIDTAEAVVADAQADAVALANQVLTEIGETIEPVQQLAQNLRDLAEDPCGEIPPNHDPNDWWNEVEFCDNPTTWIIWGLQNQCNNDPNCVLNPEQLIGIVQDAYCIVATNPPSYCDE